MIAPERLVAARVVEVPMGVDEILDRTRAQPGDRRLDLGHERRELVVDDQRAVRTMADADVAAVAEQHRHARPDFGRGDLDRIPVGLLLGDGGTGHAKREYRTEHERT